VESGEKVVYGASGVVIVDDIVNHTQRFYNPNSAARVVALALHPDDTTMASCHIHATSTSSSSTSSSSSSPVAVSLHSWAWNTQRQTEETLDLQSLVSTNGLPPISDVSSMVFSKYGHVLVLVLQHGVADVAADVAAVLQTSVVTIQWRKPLWSL